MKIADPFSELRKVTLDNGIDIYMLEWPIKFIHLTALIHSGHYANPENLDGVAHLTEHLAAKCSKLDTYREIMKLLGMNFALGSASNIATWINLCLPGTNLNSKTTTAYLHRALIEVDDYFFRFKQKDWSAQFAKEKAAITNECFWRDKLPDIRKRYEAINHEPWGCLPFMRREYPDTIAPIQLEHIAAFMDEHYGTRNMSIIVIGNIDQDTTLSILRNSVLGKRAASGKTKSLLQIPKVGKPATTFKVINAKDFGVQSLGQAGFFTRQLTSDFNFRTIEIAHEVMKANLLQELRERRNLTYAISFELANYNEVKDLQLNFRLPEDSIKDIVEIIESTIFDCAKDLTAIFKAKKQILNSWRIKHDDFTKLTESLRGQIASKYKATSQTELIDSYKTVSIEEIAQYIQYIAKGENRYTQLTVP